MTQNIAATHKPPVKWRVNVATLIAGLGFGAVLGSSLVTVLPNVGGAGGVANAIGSTAAMTGTYLCLMLMVLISRIAWLEREAGHDRMILWHRTIAPYSLVLIAVHVLFTTIGYAQSSGKGVLYQLWLLVTTYGWMLPAAVAFVLMVGLGFASHRIARRRMKYETWWTSHLYFYIAIALAFGHQINTSLLFIAHPLLKTFWIALYIAVAVLIAVSRVFIPLWLSLQSGLKVERVVAESSDVASVYISGRNLGRFNASGGQFFQWRFMTRTWWWQAHPYSLSMKPTANQLRITVKHLGDQSSSLLIDLKPGTRVIAEGPYGVFTAKQRYTNAVTAFAAGIGVTPIRAMIEDLPHSVNTTFIYRVSELQNAPLKTELDVLAKQKGWNLVYLEGNREQHPMTVAYMSAFAPALLESDIYVCGPNGFMDSVIKMVVNAGVPEKRIHHESFAF
ncbi:MAG: hypothetical protein EBS36_02520 [Actinobacteria bacterium]|nr:hypothetical protein [Actinomycetota bacterium]NBY14862.1 hypothetical protein [Actinomycetota bacterium]